MKAVVRLEAGYQPALFGMSLSHSLDSEYGEVTENQESRASKLAHQQGGHNKFLESIMLWVDVTAPRYWWQQADTYRISSKQSESTMHTITKKPLAQEHFEHPVPDLIIDLLNGLIQEKNWEEAKHLLPESFLQRRMWLMSYKTLQNIIYQRGAHKLPEWKAFISQVIEQVEHPEYLRKPEEK
jgi:hypothetical protein